MKKKVLLITVRSDVGGGPQHVYDLLKYGTSEEVSFFVAAPDEQPFGTKFRHLAKGHIPIPHRRFSILIFFKLLIFLKENDISIIHSHGKGAGIYSRLLSPFGFNVIHTFHGVHSPKSFKDRFKNLIETALIHLTDLAIFVSPSEQNNAKSCGISLTGKHQVIFNGIELLNCNQCIPKNDFKNIGIISRFDSHKNISQAIRLFSELARENQDLRLNIAGDGEQKEKLINLTKDLKMEDKVSFLGYISEPLEFLKKQDVYLSTSFGEGLPYTVLEAMSVGTIPLLSKVSGHIDIVSDDYLFELDDISDFKVKFRELLRIQGHSFRTILERDFDIKKQIKKVIEVYP